LAARPQAVLCDSLVAVTRQYAQLVSELAQTTRRMEDSIKRLQPRRQGGGAVADGSEPGAPTDSDKIFAQLRLDAHAYRAQAGVLLPEASWPAALDEVMEQVDRATVQRPAE
jgi:hypothetical protein